MQGRRNICDRLFTCSSTRARQSWHDDHRCVGGGILPADTNPHELTGVSRVGQAGKAIRRPAPIQEKSGPPKETHMSKLADQLNNLPVESVHVLPAVTLEALESGHGMTEIAASSNCAFCNCGNSCSTCGDGGGCNNCIEPED